MVIPFFLLLTGLDLSTWHYSGQWDHSRHPPRWASGKDFFFPADKRRGKTISGLSFCRVLLSSRWCLELGQPFDTVRQPAKEISQHTEDGRAEKKPGFWWHIWENKLTDSGSVILPEFFYEIIIFPCSWLYFWMSLFANAAKIIPTEVICAKYFIFTLSKMEPVEN